MPSRSNHVVINGSISPFLWMNNIQLCLCVCVCVCVCVCISQLLYPFIHQWTLGFFHILAIVHVMNMDCRYLFKLVFSFPLDIFPEMELLNHMLILLSIF